MLLRSGTRGPANALARDARFFRNVKKMTMGIIAQYAEQ
jgi:hypothetical protein